MTTFQLFHLHEENAVDMGLTAVETHATDDQAVPLSVSVEFPGTIHTQFVKMGEVTEGAAKLLPPPPPDQT